MNTEQLRKEFEAWKDSLLEKAAQRGEVCVTISGDMFDTFSDGYEAAAKSRDELIGKVAKYIHEVIEDNLHLTDGDNCTLYKLKLAQAELDTQGYGG